MPSSLPFSPQFLARDWPLLLSCCRFDDDSQAAASSVRESLANPALDSEAFLALVQAHGVLTQVSQKFVPDTQAPSPIAASLREARRSQSFAAMALLGEMFRVLEILEAAQVPAVVVKGPVLSQRAFGDPAARDYGDVDFLLRHADIQRASHALVAAGFAARISPRSMRSGKTPGQYNFRRSNASPLIELHTERTLRYFPRPLPVEAFFQRKTVVTIDNRSVPALSPEDEFVLISIHGAKHFWERLMWIADVAALARHPVLDWTRVRASAKQVGAERMVRVGLCLAGRALRAPIPAEIKRDVEGDAACPVIAKKIESWLPYAGYDPPPLAQRAIFRLRMRGQFLAAPGYLTRLSLSTTEEDWTPPADGENRSLASSSLAETLRRPFRLAKKYRRHPGP